MAVLAEPHKRLFFFLLIIPPAGRCHVRVVGMTPVVDRLRRLERHPPELTLILLSARMACADTARHPSDVSRGGASRVVSENYWEPCVVARRDVGACFTATIETMGGQFNS